MGNPTGLSKRITIHHHPDELRIIRAALRFSQASKDRPLTFHQDIAASSLIQRISDALVNVE